MSRYYLPKVYLKRKQSLTRVSPTDQVLATTPGEYRRDITFEADNEGSLSGSNIYVYDAGDDCFVTATDTTVACEKAMGIGTITIPVNTVLLSACVSGDSSDLSSNKFTIRFNQVTDDVNQDINSFFPPLVQVLNTSSQIASGPSITLPFIYDEGITPQVQLTRLDGGILDITVINLNQFNNWTIKCVF